MLMVTGFRDERSVLSGRALRRKLSAGVPATTQVLIYT